MKKVLYLLISFILFIPIMVSADGIENYYINATVMENGSMIVEEYFNMTGSYNGMERIINYRNSSTVPFVPELPSYGASALHNGDSIRVLEVRGVDVDSNFTFDNINGDVFSLVPSASKGDYGKYTVDDDLDGIDVLIYMPSKKHKAFYIKYIVTNVAIVHEDVAEIGYNFIGKQLSESIDNLVITINVPGNKDDIRVWGHGPLEGYTEIINKEKVIAKIQKLRSYTAIDVRITFDKNIITRSDKLTGVNALDKIILYETDEAERANYERMQNDIKYRELIEKAFKDLDDINSRWYYDNVEYYILGLSTYDERLTYYERLALYQDKVDEYEYKLFKSYFYKDVEYKDYSNALKCIDNVFSQDVKNKMNGELEELKSLIIVGEKNKETGSLTCGVVLSMIVLLMWLFEYRSNHKIVKIDPEFIRDIPDNTSPSEVGLLLDHTIGKDEISAGFLDLIRQKKVTFTKDDKDNYTFELVSDTLTPEEKKVSALIFGSTGKKYNSKNKRNITYECYESYKNSVIKNLKDNKYIDDKTNKIDVIIVISLIALFFVGQYALSLLLLLAFLIKNGSNRGIINWLILLDLLLISVSIAYNHFLHYSLFITIPFIILAIYIKRKFPKKVRFNVTDIGKEERKKWQGLRNYILYFTNTKNREVPEVKLLEKYLVYATAMGLGDRVLKTIKLKIEETGMDSSSFSDYTLIRSASDISKVVSVANAIGTAGVKAASSLPASSYSGGGSSYSSGSGGGGGFSGGSSGGGSFGGGGGGGRF